MMFFAFLVVFQAFLFCADEKIPPYDESRGVPPPYTLYPEASPCCVPRGSLIDHPGTHMVTVQFKSPEGILYQLCWNIYGLMFNSASSVEKIFLNNLLKGDEHGIFILKYSELQCMIASILARCFKGEGRFEYGFPKSKPLRKAEFAQMFPKGENKQWRVFAPGYNAEIKPGESRFLCAEGGFSCFSTAVEGACNISEKSQRYQQMLQEETSEFAAMVRGYAEEKMRSLEVAEKAVRQEVEVTYVNDSGEESAVVWDGAEVFDGTGKPLGEFLRYCVMQGSNLSCVDERYVRYFAFVNDSLMTLLQKCLAFDLENKIKLVRFPKGKRHLSAEDLHAMPYMTWTVVPKGRVYRSGVKVSCIISFADVTLEGVARFLQAPWQAQLAPRNFLWALDFDVLNAIKPAEDSWYKTNVQINSKKAQWVTT